MLERISFSGQHHELSRIVSHHTDVESALKLYFSPSSPDYVVRFADYVASEENGAQSKVRRDSPTRLSTQS